MSEEEKSILNRREIEDKFEEYIRKETRDRFYLRKKIGIKRLTNNYLRNARHNLLVAKMMMNVIENKDTRKFLLTQKLIL